MATDILPTFRPLGTVRCAATDVASVPSEGLPSRVVIHEDYRRALTGIEVGDYLYVLAVFHLADPTTLAGSPDSDHEQGAFSIRSSCRPNIIGMTLSRITAVDDLTISFDWLDFVDGSPVLDLKRYNWRWECALSTRRLDRRFIERQIDTDTLATVLARPAANFHGERCDWVMRAGRLAARLVHERDIWLGNPGLAVHVQGNGHLVDAVQGMTGVTLGNGRLTLDLVQSDSAVVTWSVEGREPLVTIWTKDRWSIG